MIKAIKRIGSFIGTGARAFVALIGIAGIGAGFANYTMTQGAGTDFGSVVQTSVHYVKHVLCDFTAPATICATVKAANTVGSTDVGLVVAVANTLAPGQAAMTGSSPVVIASNQTLVPVSPTPTLAGGATLVKGTTAAMTGVTSTQLIAAVTSNRIYSLRVSCKGDPANAVATKVLIQDGSGGTTLDTMSVAASGGGEQATSALPLHWTTSGNGLFAQNVTTNSSVICTASGYSGG